MFHTTLHRARVGASSVLLVVATFMLPLSVSNEALAFEFNEETSCILLNADNTDILTAPVGCLLPKNETWCNCTRSALSNPVRGESTSFEQGLIWVTEEPGVGNHRIEAFQGTLDLTSVEVGDIIGRTRMHELVPQSVGVPPGTFFTLGTEIRVTAKNGDVVDFEIVVVEISQIVPIILRYNPLDAAHSDGRLYVGRVSAVGPGDGFLFEYRYEGKEGAAHPSVEPGDAARPGFNVRFVVSIFTDDAEGSYSFAEDEDLLEVVSHIRKFDEAGGEVADPEEIMPLGAEDLCAVVNDPEPCRVFEEEIEVGTAGGENNPPEAVIVATDSQLQPLEGGFLFRDCGVARAILRGSNSSDGDGGTQGLTFLWEVLDEPSEGAATIPAESVNFMDAEVSFFEAGAYTIQLTVDDGQEANNTATAEVDIFVEDGIGPNEPPEILSVTYRLPGEEEIELVDEDEENIVDVDLVGDSLTIRFDADTTTGPDGCFQEEIYLWEADGPGAVEFSSFSEDDTDATFVVPGEYTVTLTVDDGAPSDNTTDIEIAVLINDSNDGVGPFLRGDCGQTGKVDISSAVFLLTFLFLGGDEPKCMAACDSASSGTLEITSAVYLLSFLFLGGPEPLEPGAVECGFSSTPNDASLGCEDPAGCEA